MSLLSYCRKLRVITDEEDADELIQKICGLLDVNTFEVRPPYQDNLIIPNPEVDCLRGMLFTSETNLLLITFLFF